MLTGPFRSSSLLQHHPAEVPGTVLQQRLPPSLPPLTPPTHHLSAHCRNPPPVDSFVTVPEQHLTPVLCKNGTKSLVASCVKAACGCRIPPIPLLWWSGFSPLEEGHQPLTRLERILGLLGCPEQHNVMWKPCPGVPHNTLC